MNEGVKTPEEIARQLVDDRDAYTKLYAGGEYGVDETALTRIIATAIRDAYERAAGVAEHYDNGRMNTTVSVDVPWMIARAIRALKGKG